MNGLTEWAKAIGGVKKFFINHGDAASAESFAEHLREELGADVYAPYSGAEFDIAAGIVTVDAEPIPLPRKEHQGNVNIVYSDLISASDRLSRLIKLSDGRANADMRKLTEAINRLCDEWEI